MAKNLPRFLYVRPFKFKFWEVDKQRPKRLPPPAPQLVCSYNWVVEETRQESRPVTRINVPGDVPVYRPGRVKLPLVMEEGKRYQPMGKFETSQISSVPFEGLFLATRIMNPAFRFDKVDLVISLSMLTKFLLYHFHSQGVAPVGATRFDKLLRLHKQPNRWTAAMYTVQDTLFIHSPLFRKNSDERLLTGLRFEEEVTTLRGAKFDHNAREYHHRAIQCQVGGLNCVILYEADARWLSEGQPDDTAATSHPHNTPTQKPALYSLDNSVPVFREGSGAPQSAMVEVKLRPWKAWSRRRPNPFLPGVEQGDKGEAWFHMGDAKASLYVYFTHTRRFLTGYLERCAVESITIARTARARRKMADDLSPHLPRLGELFRQLREIALMAKRPCWLQTLRSSSKWPAEISVDTQSPKLPDKHPVPQEIVERFWDSAKNPETANTPTAGESRQSKPTKAQSKDAASSPHSSEEAKEETESVNVRTQVMKGDSKKDHPPSRRRLQPTMTRRRTKALIKWRRLGGSS